MSGEIVRVNAAAVVSYRRQYARNVSSASPDAVLNQSAFSYSVSTAKRHFRSSSRPNASSSALAQAVM